jgi:hypothetical protein
MYKYLFPAIFFIFLNASVHSQQSNTKLVVEVLEIAERKDKLLLEKSDVWEGFEVKLVKLVST